MKLILLCINLFVWIISDAIAVKLIKGDHTVIKKDGATHTISKYYIVPNDYDPNNNVTKGSERTNNDINKNDYSESVDSGVSYEDQVGGGKGNSNEYSDQVSKSNEDSASVDNTEISFRFDQNYTQVKDHAGDNTAETLESVSTEHSMEGDDAYYLLVKPLIKSTNGSSNDTVDIDKTKNALQNDSRIVENSTEASEENFDDSILTNFGIAVHELSIRNIDSFWKIAKLYVDRTSDDNEFMGKLDRLSLILSIFTHLYQAAQSQKPFESMIDCIIDILQIPHVEKRCTNVLQSEIICGRNGEDPHLASTDVKLIEHQGMEPSTQLGTGDLEVEDPELQGSLAEDSNAYPLSNPYDDRRSDELTDDEEPLPDPYHLRNGAPNVSNNYSTTTPLMLHATQDKSPWIGTDKSPESIYIDTGSGVVEDKSSKSSVNKPSVPENKPTASGITDTWMVQDKSTDPRVTKSWSLVDNSSKSSAPKPWVIEDKSPGSIATRLGDVEDTPIDSGIAEPKIWTDKSTVSIGTNHQPVSFLITSSEIYKDQSTIGPTFADDQPLTTESGLATDYPLTSTSGMADQPLSTKSAMADGQPLSTVSRSAEDQPLSAESRLPGDYPSTAESEIAEEQPLSVESRLAEYQPSNTESDMIERQPSSTILRTSENPSIDIRTSALPTIEDDSTHTLPWLIEDRTSEPRHIEYKTTDKLPRNIEGRMSDKLPWHIEYKTTDKLPRNIEGRMSNKLPRHIKYKSTDKLPRNIKDRMPDKLPWNIEYKTIGKLPRHIEGRTSDKLPWNIEYKTIGKLPRHIEGRTSDELPWHIQDKTINKGPSTVTHETTNVPWIIEDRATRLPESENNEIGESPIKMYQSNSPEVTTYNDKILLDPNQNSVSNVQNPNKKPYHIYTYVIKPKLYGIRGKSGKIVHVKYKQPNSNRMTKSYRQTTSRGGNKIPHNPSNYELSLLEPPTKISSQNDNSQLKRAKPTLTYDTSYEVNPSDTPQDSAKQTKSNVGHGKKSNPKSELARPLETRTNSNEDNDRAEISPQDSSYISHSEFIIPNKHLDPTVVNRAILEHHPGIIDMVPYHPPEDKNIAENDEELQTVNDPDDINVVDEYDQPTAVNGDNSLQDAGYITHPTAQAEITIPYDDDNPKSSETQTNSDEDNDEPKLHRPYYNSHASAHSEFSTSNDYDNPTSDNNEYENGDQNTPQDSGYNSHASAHSQVSSSNDYNDPTFGINEYENGDQNRPQHSGYNSNYSAHSKVTITNDHNNPTSGDSEDIDQNAGIVPKNPYEPDYVDIPNNYDNPTPIGGKNTNGYNSHSSAHSKVTITNDNNKPTSSYIGNMDQNAGVIPKDPYEPDYVDIPNNYYEPIPVGGKNTNGYNSYSSTHSKITTTYDNNNPTSSNNGDIDQNVGVIPKDPYGPDYSDISNDDDENTPVGGESTNGYNSHSSTHSKVTITNNNNNIPTSSNSGDIDQNVGVIPKDPHEPDYSDITNDYDENTPVGGENTNGYNSHSTAHSQVTIKNDNNDPKSGDSGDIDQNVGVIPKDPDEPDYSDISNDYDENTPVGGENTNGYNSHSTAHSQVTIKNDNNDPKSGDSGDIDQNVGVIPKDPDEPDYSDISNDYDVNTLLGGENTNSYNSDSSKHSKVTIKNDNNNPTSGNSGDMDQNVGVIPKDPYEPDYSDISNDYDENTPVGGKNTNGYNSNSSPHSEFSTSNDYNDPTSGNSEDIDQNANVVPNIPYQPEYTDIVHDYDEPTPIGGKNTNGYNSHSSAHSKVTITNNNNQKTGSSEDIDPGSVSKVSNHQEYTNDPDLHQNKPQRPNYNSHTSVHSEFTQIPNNHDSGYVHYYPDFGPMVPYHPGSAQNVEEPNIVNIEHHQEYTNDPNTYDGPIGGEILQGGGSNENVNEDENTPQQPGYNSHSSAHSVVSTSNDDNDPKSNIEDMDQNTSVVPEVPQQPDYTDTLNGYDVPSHTSKGTAHVEFTIPNENDSPIPDNGQNILDDILPNWPHTPDNFNEQDDDDKQISGREPGSEFSSHSEYTYLPNDYTTGNENIHKSQILIHKDPKYAEYTNSLSENMQTRPKFVDVGHTIYKVKPSFVEYLHGKQPKKIRYHKVLKMPQTYQLFTLTNVLKLYDAVIKAIELSDVKNSDYSALINLRKIIRLIVIVAEKLDKQGGRNEWYKKIFLNAKENRHPLQLYVYKLIRQRWLHELLLILNKKNFNSHILQNPKIFSFLGSWKFPKYVQIFLKAEDIIHNDLGVPVDGDALNDLQDWFSTKTYDDFVEEVPGGLENYVTNKVIKSYEVPNDGIVVSIAGVEAEPDAHAIISILQQYLHHKKIINNQQNVIIRDNKFEMLKRIELFLKRKGYDAATISNLIHKLYSAVYLKDGKECQPHQPQFAKKMFNVILPVLRRSGR